jgi:hypothetical protein
MLKKAFSNEWPFDPVLEVLGGSSLGLVDFIFLVVMLSFLLMKW